MRRSQLDLWFDTFKPIKNTLHPADDERALDGCMFETFGPELAHVQAVAKERPDCVWTLIEASDNDKMYIGSGLHFVNRIGYFVTEVPLDPANPLHVRRYIERDVLY